MLRHPTGLLKLLRGVCVSQTLNDPLQGTTGEMHIFYHSPSLASVDEKFCVPQKEHASFAIELKEAIENVIMAFKFTCAALSVLVSNLTKHAVSLQQLCSDLC